jgi:hypothetical protein
MFPLDGVIRIHGRFSCVHCRFPVQRADTVNGVTVCGIFKLLICGVAPV